MRAKERRLDAEHRLKTGALIRAAVLMGAACAPALTPRMWNALAAFAAPIGLAFQIQDDLLDVLGVAATVGKTTGSDRARGKPTFPALLGVAASQQRVREPARAPPGRCVARGVCPQSSMATMSRRSIFRSTTPSCANAFSPASS